MSLTRRAVVTLGLLGVSGCVSGPPATRRLRLATGTAGGLYEALGNRFAAELTRRGFPTTPMPSTGSIENLTSLADDRADLGLALADSADFFVRRRPRAVSAVARIYLNYMHLVVPAASPITTVRDLAGKRVSVGPEGSGTHLTALRVLEVLRLRVTKSGFDLDGSLKALERGAIDALFWSGGVPTPAVATRRGLRLVPLDEVVLPLRRAYGPFYEIALVPTGVYGATRPVQTVGTPSYLVCRAGLPEDVAFDVTRILFESRDRLGAPDAPGMVLVKRYAITTGVVPLHEGAARYYRADYG
ncbi:TAXI family TRAP transporter solute-binding subunit [Nonomuraea sp. MCN248]|uniref:TAXI family TRAP transporter solute-binding subunit n=1 Tax=Nonomuraea corallina TaxID=2989783 RepID=A0ABT4S912_9ACTN|nr:TAXI family TRAP transporter solute-binding subunit [Nonomuraea corallina]MDA0633664.1 TAXI family TRAP transporter solute-binding subunit [Nonomuraea corallina]